MTTGFRKSETTHLYGENRVYRIAVTLHNNSERVGVVCSPELHVDTEYIENVKSGVVYLAYSASGVNYRQDYQIRLVGAMVDCDTLTVRFEPQEAVTWRCATPHTPGENTLVLEKNVRMAPLTVYLRVSGNKRVVPHTALDAWRVGVDVTLAEGEVHELLVQEGVGIYTVPLPLTKHITDVRFKPTLVYRNGKVLMDLNPDGFIEDGFGIKVEGDLSKELVWGGDQQVSFHTFVKNHREFHYTINGVKHRSTVYDPSTLPKSVMVTKAGVRFDRNVTADMEVMVNGVAHVLRRNTAFLAHPDTVRTVTMVCNGETIIAYTHTPTHTLPTLILLENPLRVRIDAPHKEPVHVRLEGVEREIVIPAGAVEAVVNTSMPHGVRNVRIEDVVNAIPLQYAWLLSFRG
jgi:hypothetical protein